MATQDPTQQLARLRAAAGAIPTLDRAAAARAQAAQAAQVDRAIQQAAPGAGARAAQQIAPVVVQQAGDAARAARAQTAETLTQIGQAGTQLEGQAAQTGLQQAARAQREAQVGQAAQGQLERAAASRELSKQLTKTELAQTERQQAAGRTVAAELSFLTRKQREDLAKLGRDVKRELFDARLEFAEDERGSRFANERQLADFAVATAKSREELQDRVQTMEQQHKRKLQLQERAYQVLQTKLAEDFARAEQRKDQASKAKIAEIRRASEAAAAKARQKAARNGAFVNALVAGGTAAAVGGPVAGVAVGVGSLVAPELVGGLMG